MSTTAGFCSFLKPENLARGGSTIYKSNNEMAMSMRISYVKAKWCMMFSNVIRLQHRKAFESRLK